LKIDTTRFGPLTIGEEKIITMPFGMLGFPEEKRYVILHHREDSPFFWYQSVDDPALAFVITSPFLFKPDYSVRLEDTVEQMSWIQDKEGDALELYVVVNIPKSSPDKMTANLIGPILINNRTRQAIQMVITDSPYSHRFSLVAKNQGSTRAAGQTKKRR
jgi:flagellar assembly factor FliW